MTSPRDGLDAGRCPSPESAAAPAAVFNPPGLAALAYRIGVRTDFLARMLALLATATLPDGDHAGSRPLASLASRHGDDPAVALLDAWADVADVLTFYQERIADEGYLRTAAERRSVLELARLVGQELGPGVAASAFLAFTVDDSPGSPATVLVPQGTQVKSIPGQDELPQTFETARDFTARAAWNALVPRRGRPQDLAGAQQVFLAGTDLRLAAGDLLLLVAAAPGQPSLRTVVGRVAATTVDADRLLTRVALEKPLDLSATDLSVAGVEVAVFALRQRAAFFGHNAPRWGSLPRGDVMKADPYSESSDANNWDRGRTVWTDSKGVPYASTGPSAVYLDQKLQDLVAPGWAVFVGQDLAGQPLPEQVYLVTGHSEVSLADYAIAGESTGLALATVAGDSLPARLPALDVRRTTVYLGSEPLPRADQPIDARYPSPEADGNLASLTLESSVEDLQSGVPLVVAGRLSDGSLQSLVVLLQEIDQASEPGHTRLIFQQPLPAGLLDRAAVVINANVVVATHGESVAEVLGSGDTSRSNQRFTLSRPPLTFLSAPVPGGRGSSLVVRVDGVAWREVDSLYGEDGKSQSYMVEIDDDGRATVRFGDGRNGARLPTGNENVTAAYRSGVGLAGRVGANTLQLLVTRPLGIREVTNPLPAAGAAAPDTVAQARSGGAVAARTLGRIVSLSDFEDFARTFAGIAKVAAAPIAGVHLTVAGVDGDPVDPGSALYTNLLQALEAARLPGPPVSLSSYEPLPFRVAAQLVTDPRYRPEDVAARVSAALLAAFAFDRRELAAPVYASDVVRLIQSVAGVAAVDLDALYVGTGTAATLAPVLTAQPARFAGGRVLPAQLLYLPAGSNLSLRTRTP
ncbi:MAG: putative baseplate assembly protein [Acidobacteria bacterium]|nr:putative baseplate assembly protein [Acidobacteriota bacterium]